MGSGGGGRRVREIDPFKKLKNMKRFYIGELGDRCRVSVGDNDREIPVTLRHHYIFVSSLLKLENLVDE